MAPIVIIVNMSIILNRQGLKRFLQLFVAIAVTYGNMYLILSFLNADTLVRNTIRMAFLALWAIGLILYQRIIDL